MQNLDQFRVFNKEISAAEVTTLYNENPLVASYRFEGNSNDDMRTYNGTDSNVTYEFGLNFTPDLVWIKPRSFADNHALSDSTRGVNKSLASNTSSAEQTTLGVASFDTGGFTLPNWGNVNDSGEEFVAWCFKANGGTTSSNTDGSVTRYSTSKSRFRIFNSYCNCTIKWCIYCWSRTKCRNRFIYYKKQK